MCFSLSKICFQVVRSAFPSAPLLLLILHLFVIKHRYLIGRTSSFVCKVSDAFCTSILFTCILASIIKAEVSVAEMMLKHLESWRMKIGEDKYKGIKTDELVVTKSCDPF